MGVPKILTVALLAAMSTSAASAQEDTIKVGVLHSLSGTMAISETTLKDVMLMLIDKQNEAGGLLGTSWSILPLTGRSLPKRPAN